MNPISKIYFTKYQIESTNFKVVQLMNLGGANQELLIKIIDDNNYCYFINEYDNYIYPLIINSSNNQFYYSGVNYANLPNYPKIKYLKVGINKPLYNFLARPKSINEQRAWLQFRRKKKVKHDIDSLGEGNCSFAPTVNIIAIEYEVHNKKYNYSIDSKQTDTSKNSLEYIFK